MKQLTLSLFLLLIVLMAVGCGVRGDPIPPEQSARIGRGKPGFERAAKSLDIDSKDSEFKRKRKGRDGN